LMIYLVLLLLFRQGFRYEVVTSARVWSLASFFLGWVLMLLMISTSTWNKQDRSFPQLAGGHDDQSDRILLRSGVLAPMRLQKKKKKKKKKKELANFVWIYFLIMFLTTGFVSYCGMACD
jgi:hypothetical protein